MQFSFHEILIVFIHTSWVSLSLTNVTRYKHFLEPSILSADVLQKTGPNFVKSLPVSPHCFWHPTFFQRIKFFVLLYVVFGRLAVCSVIWLWVTQISSLRMWLFFRSIPSKPIKYTAYVLLIFKYFNLGMMKVASILSTLSYRGSKISVNFYFILLVVENIYPLSCPIFRHQLLRLVPW